jgi:hypothetical protein
MTATINCELKIGIYFQVGIVKKESKEFKKKKQNKKELVRSNDRTSSFDERIDWTFLQ